MEKARLEKKIASLESERQAFVRGKSSTHYKARPSHRVSEPKSIKTEWKEPVKGFKL